MLSFITAYSQINGNQNWQLNICELRGEYRSFGHNHVELFVPWRRMLYASFLRPPSHFVHSTAKNKRCSMNENNFISEKMLTKSNRQGTIQNNAKTIERMHNIIEYRFCPIAEISTLNGVACHIYYNTWNVLRSFYFDLA